MEKIAHFLQKQLVFSPDFLSLLFIVVAKLSQNFSQTETSQLHQIIHSYTPSAALILYIYTQSLFIQNIIVRLSKKSIVMLIEILLFVNDLSIK